MSDFDKEAEREKLREKYERDQQERQTTQRMSDLLLKGATMTNSHCGTCGDPLFQMDGTTFCPSCHGNPDAVEGTDLEAEPADDTPGAADDASPARPDAGAAGAVTADEAASSGGDARGDRQTVDANQTAGGNRATPAEPVPRDSPSRDAGSASEPDASDATDRERTATPRPSTPSASVDGDLEVARDSLVAALEKFAAEAAATDDPRYARECLEAAREASETLESLR